MFETEVPIPNVIVETPRIMPLVIAGKETHFEIRLRNEGLIAANGVRLNVPSDARFVVTPLVEDIGSIPAKSSITIPVAIRLRSTPPTFGAFAKERALGMPKAGDSCEIDTGIPCRNREVPKRRVLLAGKGSSTGTTLSVFPSAFFSICCGVCRFGGCAAVG